MIPFYRPFFDHTEWINACHSGQGRADFEAAVAARMGARYGIAFAYGRTGLFAILQALNIKQADIVLSAYTCVVVTWAIVASGNQPVFVDIDLADYNMDLDALRRAITPRTRAIVATHMYGYPTDIMRIRQIADDHHVLIIEDRAQKLTDSSTVVPCLHSDAAICSFGLNKELCTLQGGMVVTDLDNLAQQIHSYRGQNMHRYALRTALIRWIRLLANYGLYRPSIYGLLSRLGIVGQHDRLDENSNVPSAKLPADFDTVWADFQGRIGLAQLKKLEKIRTCRRTLAELYAYELGGLPNIVLPPIIPNANYSYYTLRIPDRDKIGFRQRMLTKGVAIDETYEYALPYLKPYRQYAVECPNARQAAAQVVNLPIYPNLSTTDAQYIAASVRNILETYYDRAS